MDTINLNDEISKKLIEKAQYYKSVDEFIDELGWEDWMNELCTSESSALDGGELQEKDINNINQFLLKIWEKANG